MNTRFVIQKHSRGSEFHWDLMLQRGERLLTWRVFVPAGEMGAGQIRAERIFDHPVRFLTYEGPVQGGTGKVEIEDSGGVSYESCGEDEVRFVLDGEILKGGFILKRQCGQQWFLCRKGTVD